MQTTLEFHSEMGGGIVIMEPDKIAALDDDALYCMNIAVDPDGKTDIVCDYAGQDWRQVWAEQTHPLAQMAARGQMAFAVTDKAKYKVRVVIGENINGADLYIAYKQALQVFSGQIAVIEASYLLETKFSGEEPHNYTSIPAANGSYLITFFGPSAEAGLQPNMAEIIVHIAPVLSASHLTGLADTLPYIRL